MTRLSKKLKDLKAGCVNTLITVCKLLKKVESVDSDFKRLHLALVDLLTSDDDFEREQTSLDEYNKIVDDLHTRIDHVVLSFMVSTKTEPRMVALKRLRCLKKNMDSAPTDDCLVHQHEEQLRESMHELRNIFKSLATLDLDEKDELTMLQNTLNAMIFDSSLKFKRMLEKSATDAAATQSRQTIKESNYLKSRCPNSTTTPCPGNPSESSSL